MPFADEGTRGVPAEEPGDRSSVRALGPVFISYRASDGQRLAYRLAWALRAAGVPVWHDETDMPPGDTVARMGEALSGGLAGGVVVVTSEVASSTAVRETEFPMLRELSERDDRFALVLANSVHLPGQDQGIDYDAPDQLLGTALGTLSVVKQYALSPDGGEGVIAQRLAELRMDTLRAEGVSVLTINIQTRADPRSVDQDAGLVVRTLPPSAGRRAPPLESWAPLAWLFNNLPRLVTSSGASEVRVSGGAHLSVAFALGASLPTTAFGPVSVEDQHGAAWQGDGGEAAGLLESVEDLGRDGAPLAVFLDVAQHAPPTDTFGRYVRASPRGYSGSLVIALQDRSGLIDAGEGFATASDVAARIRRVAASHDSNHIHLFLRCPFAIAVFLGRMLNTLEIHLFEWEQASGEEPSYVPSFVVASGRGDVAVAFP